jgi:amino acid adenylation domain-containing protein
MCGSSWQHNDPELLRLWHAQAASTPAAMAVEWESGSWTYDQLQRQSDLWATQLRALGAGPEQFVALALGRGPQTLAALLGTLKCGAAFLPLDAAQPGARLLAMIGQAAPRVVVAEPALAEDLRPLPASLVIVDDPWRPNAPLGSAGTAVRSMRDAILRRWQSGRSAAEPTQEPNERLAYAIFTSGSTGQPKAVLVTHRGLGHLVRAQRAMFGLRPGSRVLQFASLVFDAAVSEIFVTLCSGATLCLAAAEDLLPGEPLRRTLCDRGITVATLPPSVLGRLGEATLPALRTLVVAGEACPAELVNRFSPGRRMINAYGPTEATVCATMYLCPAQCTQPPPIGRPIQGFEARVVAADGTLAAEGHEGELYLAGPGLARGYLNQPELTAEKFVALALAGDARRWYRTGDVVRQLPDGNLQYVGRIDEQIKIRGVRIEPGEVAATLRDIPGVREAVVLPQREGSAEPYLAAYVAVADDSGLTETSLMNALRQRLPVHLLPSRLVLVDRLPLNRWGKVDRQALAAAATRPAWPARHPADSPVARDRLEWELTRIWRDVLQCDDVRVTDDFFLLGGDSLRAMELLARIQCDLGYTLPTHRLMSGPTIAQMAEALREQDAGAAQAWTPLVALQSEGSGRPWFCVHPGGGNALCYLPLARRMARSRPMYAFQAAGLEGAQRPHTSVETMAAAYVEVVRDVQPDGPYYLGGWSFGGIVAYEMARQLAAHGHKVALLAIIDVAPVYSFGVLATIFPDAFAVRRSDRETQIRAFLERTADAQLVPPGASRQYAERVYDLFVANIDAMLNYRPEPYPGRAVLFRGQEKLIKHRRDPYEEWQELCLGGVDLEWVPGHHLSMIHEPHVAHLAARLERHLDQAHGVPVPGGAGSPAQPVCR